ncbi:hypothetical protein AB6A40_010355 [Gnathostoma spinigerum]|uniref:Phosphoinositide-specific phospholipase C EF-hand-like domain-containing protein n=1 Tax=Gnathostoma spinigerum TaxID=75299 RepID=A0ABD6EUV0_9BILA
MEQVDVEYAIKLIQEYEPNAECRDMLEMFFEGFVRFLNDPCNFVFVPEDIEPDPVMLNFPMGCYYV